MKSIRLISLLLAISVLLAFSACSRSAEPTSPSKEQQSAQVQESQSTSESETEDSPDNSSQQQQNGQGSTGEDLKLPPLSDDSDSNCSKKEFGYFSLLLPKNYVIESNTIYEDNTELARKIAEITSVDMISDTESPFSTYDRIYSDAENISECHFGIYPGKRYSIQKEVSEGGMTGFQNTIIYCIKLENNIVSITFYPQRGIGIDEQRKGFEEILNSISPLKKSDSNDNSLSEEEPTEEELIELLDKAMNEINSLATDPTNDVLYDIFGEDIEFDPLNQVIIDDITYQWTSRQYRELVDYYSQTFTGEALNWILDTRFADVDGVLYGFLGGGATGTHSKAVSIEKLEENTYRAHYQMFSLNVLIYEDDTTFSIEKTDAGYRVSDIDHRPDLLDRK